MNTMILINPGDHAIRDKLKLKACQCRAIVAANMAAMRCSFTYLDARNNVIKLDMEHHFLRG